MQSNTEDFNEKITEQLENVWQSPARTRGPGLLKLVTIATSLERLQNERQIDHHRQFNMSTNLEELIEGRSHTLCD